MIMLWNILPLENVHANDDVVVEVLNDVQPDTTDRSLLEDDISHHSYAIRILSLIHI